MSDVVIVELRLIEQIFRLSTTPDKQADLEENINETETFSTI